MLFREVSKSILAIPIHIWTRKSSVNWSDQICASSGKIVLVEINFLTVNFFRFDIARVYILKIPDEIFFEIILVFFGLFFAFILRILSLRLSWFLNHCQFLLWHWEEVLEPYDLWKHFPIECVEVGTRNDHSESVVELVKYQLRMKDSVVHLSPLLLVDKVSVDLGFIHYLGAVSFTLPLQEQGYLNRYNTNMCYLQELWLLSMDQASLNRTPWST